MTKEEYFEQAVNAFGDEKLDESIEFYQNALALDANYQDALHGLGMALFNRGRLDEAIAVAKKLIEIDPDDILAHTSLSMFYQSQGRIEEAEKEGNAARILGWKQELRGNPGSAH
jgi:tetratricopeptide (TPR) repeat protein